MPRLQKSFKEILAENLEHWAWTFFAMGDQCPRELNWHGSFLTSNEYIKNLDSRIRAGKAPRMMKVVRIVRVTGQP
jgi:hypothetical protein